ncbi:hypothetical protein AB0K93_35100 [Streptomyces sp. NPDC052676]|uniref:hypothetical protein n=1 Tax=Streptomyces sp. NPDC052676 TaxID=3154953 RepID=UPI00342B96D2
MTLLAVFAALVVCWVALRGFLAYPPLRGWVKAVAPCCAPGAALAWPAVVTADAFLSPETAPCPAEPPREGVIGHGEVRGVSTPFSHGRTAGGRTAPPTRSHRTPSRCPGAASR